MRAGWIWAVLLMAGQAEAGLTLCNDAATRVSVAIAYAADGDWVSEGWWGVEAGACAEVQSGALKQRHFYYTMTGTVAFVGDGYSFCTRRAAFTLTGADGDCVALKAVQREFAHIDTGADAPDFTYRLAAAPAVKQDTAAPNPATIPDPAEDLMAELVAAGIPSFEQGLLGEPFTVSAVMQGCGPTEGGYGCTFYAEGARWIAYRAGRSNRAALSAMASMAMGAPVLVSGDLISMGDITVEAAIAALEQGFDPFAGQRAAMQGLWVSTDDPKSRIRIVGSERTDLYDGEVFGTSVVSLADFCNDQAEGGVLLQVQQMGGDPADLQCFQVLFLDDDRMDLSYIGRGNTLSYVRP